MTNKQRDREFIVVWAGGEGLVPDRDTRVSETWTPPPRLYNKSGRYIGKAKRTKVVKPVVEPNLIHVFKSLFD